VSLGVYAKGRCSHAREWLVVFLKYMTMELSLIVCGCGCHLLLSIRITRDFKRTLSNCL
jgi:hypothetical protein